MVDISLEGSHDFWSQFPDPSVYKVINALESMEKNFYDGEDEFEKKMNILGEVLENFKEDKIGDDKQVFVDVIAYLRTSRYLRVLQALDAVQPGLASKVISFSEKSQPENKSAQFFLQRNIIFERYRLLYRIFSPDRLSLLSDALEM